MAAKQASDDVLSDINVTPLVDVMLVLLVVMMVTASTIVTQSLAVDLPEGKTGTASERHIIVTITQQGALLLDDRPVDSTALRREVAQLKAQDTNVQALIAADGSALHARVVEVLDLLREARVTRVAVGVTPATP